MRQQPSTLSLLLLSGLVSLSHGFQFMKNWKLPSRNKDAQKIQNRFEDKKLVVITAADSELGRKTTNALLETGDYHVIGGVSNQQELNKMETQEHFTPMLCNLESFDSVRDFCSNVNDYRLSKPLERVVCHAGDELNCGDQVSWTADNCEAIMQRNFLSPFLLTGLLLGGMEDSFDGRLTLVCGNTEVSNEKLDLTGFEAGFTKPVAMADGSTEANFNARKAQQDAKLCQKLLVNFLHEKYHKLTHVVFNDFETSTAVDQKLGLFDVLHDSKGAEKSGVSWTHSGKGLEEYRDPACAYDIDTAYELFKLSEKVTKADWPSIKVVTSPCPTLKVIGAVTKGQVKKQELKRMRELGRPGISEPEVKQRVTKRQKIAAFADRVVTFTFRHTIKRAARIISSRMLGRLPDEALTGSFEDEKEAEATAQEQAAKELYDANVAALEEEIFSQMSKEAAATKPKFGDKKLVVLTGASSGLGRKTALALLRSGDYHVIGAVRDLDKMEAVAEVDGFNMDNFTPMYCEMNSFESVREFCKNVEEFRGDHPIDRLMCNAGVYQPSLRHAKWSKDGHEQTMQINFLSHFLMISLLMDSMLDSNDPRITMVGSVTGNDNTVGGGGVYPIADLHDMDGLKAGFKNPIEMADGYGFIGAKAYKDSKLCLMILANFLHAKYHRSTGIAFSSMYPGCIAESPLFREKRAWFRKYFPIFMKFITGGFVGEHEAGQRLFQVAHDPRCEKSGVYWSWNGGPREGRGAEALEKGGQISGGGGAGGGWDSIFENDQSGKVLNIDTGFKMFQYASAITGAEWPSSLDIEVSDSHFAPKIDVLDVDFTAGGATAKNTTQSAGMA